MGIESGLHEVQKMTTIDVKNPSAKVRATFLYSVFGFWLRHGHQ
jgi:hypothetical protein